MTQKRFHAVCKLQRRKPEKTLTPEERREATENEYLRVFNREADRGRGRVEVCFPACQGFETEDRGLFEAHMADAHNITKGSYAPKKGGGTKADVVPAKMWNGPRLTAEGKDFEPTGLQPGATVTWHELVPTGETYTEHTPELGTREVVVREWAERSGQVWSLAPYPKSAWVIPFEKRDGELAVRVRAQGLDERLEHEATWTANGYRDAA